MAEADAALEAGMTSAEFTELVGSDSNDDESMREERARSMGYLVHDDLRDEYTTEFFYAANVANGRKVVPGMQMGSIPEYDVYKTTDNRIVVKIHEEGCTRYLMVARKYIKGNVSYKAGDDIWELGRRTATEYIQRKYFDDQVEEWYQAALKGKKIKWYFDRFKSSYLPRILED